jgi:transposase
MQKALTEMNVQIHRVLSDITGYSGMAIIRAILAGERDALKLAQMKHPQVKASTEQIVKALEGDYRSEHLFALQTAVELYDAYQLKITGSHQWRQTSRFQTEKNQESRRGHVPTGCPISDAKQYRHRSIYPSHQSPTGCTNSHKRRTPPARRSNYISGSRG